MAKTISRRKLLTGGGSLLDFVAAPGPDALRATSMSDRVLTSRVVGPPPLPPLSVVAYNRMAFGPRSEDWAAWEALGATDDDRLAAYVAQQLDPASIDDSACDARIAAENFTTLGKTLRQLWEDHVLAPDIEYSFRILPATETRWATWLRALYSKRQLLEVLADFWHNHFNVFGYHYHVAPAFVYYDRDVIRANALGNFRDFIEAVGNSTPMLYYLDNVYSSDGGPNENYARELFELHTMGADNYLGHMLQDDVPVDGQGRPIAFVDEDVYEAARCFTGWTVNDAHWELPDYDPGPPEQYIPGTFLLWEDWHDRFQKWVLGSYVPSDQNTLTDGRAVYDILAEHPATASYVCTKLCRRLIADKPPQSVIDAAIATWTANLAAPDQIAQVVQTILLSDEFKQTWGQKVKRPFELVASLQRATAVEWTPSASFGWSYEALGQELFYWSTPDGYPDTKEHWTSTNVMLRRWNITTRILENWLEPEVQVDLASQMPAEMRSSNEIVEWWIQHIMGREINAEDRQEIVEFMAQGRNPDYDLPQDQIDERMPRAVQLICMTPDFQYR